MNTISLSMVAESPGSAISLAEAIDQRSLSGRLFGEIKTKWQNREIKVCAFEGCTTQISHYHKGPMCFRHTHEVNVLRLKQASKDGRYNGTLMRELAALAKQTGFCLGGSNPGRVAMGFLKKPK